MNKLMAKPENDNGPEEKEEKKDGDTSAPAEKPADKPEEEEQGIKKAA